MYLISLYVLLQGNYAIALATSFLTRLYQELLLTHCTKPSVVTTHNCLHNWLSHCYFRPTKYCIWFILNFIHMSHHTLIYWWYNTTNDKKVHTMRTFSFNILMVYIYIYIQICKKCSHFSKMPLYTFVLLTGIAGQCLNYMNGFRHQW